MWSVEPDVERFASVYLGADKDYDVFVGREGKSLKEVWKTPKASLSRDLPAGDFAELSVGAIAASQEAARALEEALASDVELLPLRMSGRAYRAVNVVRSLDILDKSKSRIEYYPGTKGVRRILKHAFRKKALLESVHLFKIPETCATHIYATASFKRLVESRRLKGLTFVRL